MLIKIHPSNRKFFRHYFDLIVFCLVSLPGDDFVKRWPAGYFVSFVDLMHSVVLRIWFSILLLMEKPAKIIRSFTSFSVYPKDMSLDLLVISEMSLGLRFSEYSKLYLRSSCCISLLIELFSYVLDVVHSHKCSFRQRDIYIFPEKNAAEPALFCKEHVII